MGNMGTITTWFRDTEARSLFHPCLSCGLPMCGILKPSPHNQAPAHVARETCETCEAAEELVREEERRA